MGWVAPAGVGLPPYPASSWFPAGVVTKGPTPPARDKGALPPSPCRLQRHNVIDNREVTLRDELLKVLPRCKAANFALGYLFGPGNRYQVSAAERRLVRV